jgi:hypothetical protein
MCMPSPSEHTVICSAEWRIDKDSRVICLVMTAFLADKLISFTDKAFARHTTSVWSQAHKEIDDSGAQNEKMCNLPSC